jgi:hypothetical protein
MPDLVKWITFFPSGLKRETLASKRGFSITLVYSRSTPFKYLYPGAAFRFRLRDDDQTGLNQKGVDDLIYPL